jgi:hypothetical protein
MGYIRAINHQSQKNQKKIFFFRCVKNVQILLIDEPGKIPDFFNFLFFWRFRPTIKKIWCPALFHLVIAAEEEED